RARRGHVRGASRSTPTHGRPGRRRQAGDGAVKSVAKPSDFDLDAEEIITAAVEIFQESGLDAVSMRSVSARLGVSPVPLYSRLLTWAAGGFGAGESGVDPPGRSRRRTRPGGDPGGVAPADAETLFDLHIRYVIEGITRDAASDGAAPRPTATRRRTRR